MQSCFLVFGRKSLEERFCKIEISVGKLKILGKILPRHVCLRFICDRLLYESEIKIYPNSELLLHTETYVIFLSFSRSCLTVVPI